MLMLGCGNIPTTSEGVAFLQVHPPVNKTVAVGGTLQLEAIALDKEGHPLDVAITWRTPDEEISIGETSGLVTGVAVGTGRAQAVVGNDELVSDFVTITVIAAPATGPARQSP